MKDSYLESAMTMMLRYTSNSLLLGITHDHDDNVNIKLSQLGLSLYWLVYRWGRKKTKDHVGHSQDQTRCANMYGPYSLHLALRGSTDDLHFAMGYEPGSFTYPRLTQGLSVSSGRWVCSQLIAASMRLNYDLSLSSRGELRRNPLLNERVVQWELGGAHLYRLDWEETPPEEVLAAADEAGPSSDNAPAAAASTDAVEPVVLDEFELRKWTKDPTTDDIEIRKITPEDQMQDPHIRFILESCTTSREDRETWSPQRASTTREHMLAYWYH
eukprot:6172832-Pleurochrysis_carterae.AAC.1